jgi:hypothetical protein
MWYHLYVYFLFVLIPPIPTVCPLFYLAGYQILINNCRSCNTLLLINSDKTNRHWMYSFFLVCFWGLISVPTSWDSPKALFLWRDFSRYGL